METKYEFYMVLLLISKTQHLSIWYEFLAIVLINYDRIFLFMYLFYRYTDPKVKRNGFNFGLYSRYKFYWFYKFHIIYPEVFFNCYLLTFVCAVRNL